MAIDLVCRLLDYTPSTRLTPLEACAHAFFDELRDPETRLPNGSFPLLFNFSQYGQFSPELNTGTTFFPDLELNINPSLNPRLLPAHMQGQQAAAAAASSSSNLAGAANASATGGNTTGSSAATAAVHEKPITAATTTATNRSNNSPPLSVVPDAVAAAATGNVHGPGESDAMNSLDDTTTASGDLISKDRT